MSLTTHTITSYVTSTSLGEKGSLGEIPPPARTTPGPRKLLSRKRYIDIYYLYSLQSSKDSLSLSLSLSLYSVVTDKWIAEFSPLFFLLFHFNQLSLQKKKKDKKQYSWWALVEVHGICFDISAYRTYRIWEGDWEFTF